MITCPSCGDRQSASGGPPDTEYFTEPEHTTIAGEPMIALRYQESVECRSCHLHTEVEQGTAYWSEASWNACAELDYYQVDGEQDADGRPYLRYATGEPAEVESPTAGRGE